MDKPEGRLGAQPAPRLAIRRRHRRSRSRARCCGPFPPNLTLVVAIAPATAGWQGRACVQPHGALVGRVHVGHHGPGRPLAVSEGRGRQAGGERYMRGSRGACAGAALGWTGLRGLGGGRGACECEGWRMRATLAGIVGPLRGVLHTAILGRRGCTHAARGAPGTASTCASRPAKAALTEFLPLTLASFKPHTSCCPRQRGDVATRHPRVLPLQRLHGGRRLAGGGGEADQQLPGAAGGEAGEEGRLTGHGGGRCRGCCCG